VTQTACAGQCDEASSNVSKYSSRSDSAQHLVRLAVPTTEIGGEIVGGRSFRQDTRVPCVSVSLLFFNGSSHGSSPMLLRMIEDTRVSRFPLHRG
jgi:hypothetical protein